ncbi:MAG: STAS domain-containing protein [Candidatus Omnitrophica bacterium]|nr:hypothetical protein [bacterium]NUN95968.1 STAS domain-containing protein [Candidatus Omnitrophota bacterium]
MDQLLKIVVVDQAGECRVRLAGQLAKLEVYRFRSALDCLIEDGHRSVIVDMREVTFIDSAGIGALVKARGAAVKVGGSVKVIPPTDPTARKVLEMASIGKIIPILEPVGTESAVPDRAPTPQVLSIGGSGGFDPQRLLIQIQDLTTRIESLENRLAAIEDQDRGRAWG